MRRWGFTAALGLSTVGLAASSAPAQPAPDVSATAEAEASAGPVRLGYGALPGGLHVASAEALPQGAVAIGLLSGYGARDDLAGLKRAIGDVAVAYGALPMLSIGLSLDGRYDKHTDDDGWVGDPHLLIRALATRGKLSFGGQLGVWVPGKDAPSIVGSAISGDARLIATLATGFGTLSLDAGFRLDNSAKSVEHRETLSIADQMSLGVSDFHAALVGAALEIPLGARAHVGLEGSADIFVGDGAPSPIVRGGARLGVALSDAFSVLGYVDVASVPDAEFRDSKMAELVLVPFEPTVTAGVGLQARFGGPHRAAATSQVVRNETPVPVVVVETADVAGVVVDDAGKPVVGAKVTVKLKNNTGTAITDDKGGYAIAHLPIGKTVDGKTELDDTGAELAIEVANKKPGSATLTLVKGANAVPRIALDPLLPPGQLRAVIINVGTSRPVAGATVTIDPGGLTATSGPDGKFTVDLPPGKYKLTVTARGLAQQQLDVNIEQNGVAIKNIDMHR